MRALLISTYDLGRQPLGLAAPAAALRAAGVEVECVDTSRQPLLDEQAVRSDVVAFHLPMHTATRLAVPLIERVRRLNPSARLVAYGLYAALNDEWLRTRGVEVIVAHDADDALTVLAVPAAAAARQVHAALVVPDRSTLSPPSAYAAVQMPDGTRRTAGNTDATRGCKHLCRHCPIVPVYQGRFRAVPLAVVIADVRTQVAAGAGHITFGDPDFLNGPTHARRIVQALHEEWPDVTYDVTIKIEHLLRHHELLPLLRNTGCLFVTSAVESVDDEVLAKLRKGHTRADFSRAVDLCRHADLPLAPTFVPFTPWTTVEGYIDLLEEIAALDVIDQVAPVQLAIRLLVTARSALLELDDVRAHLGPFDAAALAWPWRHREPSVDALQEEVMQEAAAAPSRSRREVFDAIRARAYAHAGRASGPLPPPRRAPAPFLTESWYCCAEPLEFQL